MSSEICPFCKDEDFDLIGLKFHIENHCDAFKETPSIPGMLSARANPAPDDKLVEALTTVIATDSINTGYEPSESCFRRAIDKAREVLAEHVAHSARDDGPGDGEKSCPGVDPGVGYRLLKQGELLEYLDEYWHLERLEWKRTSLSTGVRINGEISYRRCITSAMQEGGV